MEERRIPFEQNDKNIIRNIVDEKEDYKSSTSRKANCTKNIINYNPQTKKLKTWHIILIALAGIVIVGAIIFAAVKLSKNGKEKKIPIVTDTDNINDKQTENENHNQEEPSEKLEPNLDNDFITKEEAIKAFEPSFKVKSKSNTLNQLLMKYSEKQISVTNGMKTSFTSFYKAIYDIYTLNETSSTEKDKEFYTTKYSTVITVNSQCQTFSANQNDCILEKYLDLNTKNRNLGQKDEEDPEIINEVILPICIIEHSDTNLIFSVTCSKTLPSNIKNDIIMAFQNIKPDSLKGITEDKNIAETSSNEKDNKIYINSFSKVCENYDGDPKKTANCETNRTIITDKEGNLISINKTSSSDIFQDENNKNSRTTIYFLEDITNQNSGNFNPSNYKTNLDVVLGVIEPLLEREEYISQNGFDLLLEGIMYGDSNPKQNLRILNDHESDDDLGVNEKDIFSKYIYNVPLGYALKNDIGQGHLENAKAISNLAAGNMSKELSHDEVDTN